MFDGRICLARPRNSLPSSDVTIRGGTYLSALSVSVTSSRFATAFSALVRPMRARTDALECTLRICCDVWSTLSASAFASPSPSGEPFHAGRSSRPAAGASPFNTWPLCLPFVSSSCSRAPSCGLASSAGCSSAALRSSSSCCCHSSSSFWSCLALVARKDRALLNSRSCTYSSKSRDDANCMRLSAFSSSAASTCWAVIAHSGLLDASSS
mmetsp:Transcript_40115/g.100408  ORF Transcript_40115/g.100408 Transcript_40115/m.100408 type:complete len:211 (-) Transcript_40115:653-1285(-)